MLDVVTKEIQIQEGGDLVYLLLQSLVDRPVQQNPSYYVLEK